jgi:hypothetical protein
MVRFYMPEEPFVQAFTERLGSWRERGFNFSDCNRFPNIIQGEYPTGEQTGHITAALRSLFLIGNQKRISLKNQGEIFYTIIEDKRQRSRQTLYGVYPNGLVITDKEEAFRDALANGIENLNRFSIETKIAQITNNELPFPIKVLEKYSELQKQTEGLPDLHIYFKN